MSIDLFLTDGTFDLKNIKAMSMALDDVCKALNIVKGSPAQGVIAERIIALARNGERSPTLLRDRVLWEASFTNEVRRTGGNEMLRSVRLTGPACNR